MMKSPLWTFFITLKQYSTAPLAIDQYIYFLKAIHELPLQESIKSNNDLLQFCKLFWLKKEADENLFDRLFWDIFSDSIWDPILLGENTKLESREVAEKPELGNPNDLDTVANVEQNEIAPTEPGETSGSDVQNVHTAETFVDFELLLRETAGPASTTLEEEYVDHDFNLLDQSIMPFDLRYFAQRLRRRVETSFFEYTNKLDVPKMIREFCSKGYMESFIYQRRNASNSNIVLLADRLGSMLSYEYWERQLKYSFRAIPSCEFEHYSFYNLPKKKSQSTDYLLKHVNNPGETFDSGTHSWNDKTWFFIFSDAGAHSGSVNNHRMDESIDLWYYLKGISSNVYWLNPVPLEMQNDCTSKRLNYSIPMHYPDQQGLISITNRTVDE